MALDLHTWLPLTDEEATRFLALVQFTDSGCWLWTGSVTGGNSKSRTDWGGYGKFWLRGHTVLAHRLMYVARRGPITGTLDHAPTCARNCINPAHVEDVTVVENVMRGNGVMAVNARKTHCKRGHPLSGSNLMIVPGGRMCRTCGNERYKWFRQRKKARRES